MRVYPSFILRWAYIIYGFTCVYAYNLAWGGLKYGKNGGDPYGFYLFFALLFKSFICHVVVPLSYCFCWEIFFFIPPCLFTVHVRPVLSPCQVGNTFLHIQFFVYTEVHKIICFTHHIHCFIIITPLCNRDHRELLDKCSLIFYKAYNTLKTSFVFICHIFLHIYI